jgi:hypothetical protein
MSVWLAGAVICAVSAAFCMYAERRVTQPFWQGVFRGAFYAYIIAIPVFAAFDSYL